MLFNSLDFAVFFTVVTTLYFASPHKWRWLLLLVSSCYFYISYVPIYILILGFTIVVDYFAGILIEQGRGGARRTYLVCSLVANIGVLSLFKYYNFLNAGLRPVLHELGLKDPLPFLFMLLPIGLSFHTFQAMSYTIEVYRGRQKAERHFGIYALYVMFYPQLVAGPIERPQNLLHQFRDEHAFDYGRITDGLKQMAWGLFKKVVVADNLAVVVDRAYDHPDAGSGISYVIATVFFGYQIYCDFSGYSDMAIGAARVMGFKLMRNFNCPYHARSIPDFWHRWHISLSTWFRDYVYVPMGGNRVALPRWCLNILVVFLLSGVWHGANMTFIIWGALHGFYYLFSAGTRDLRTRIKGSLRLGENVHLQSAIVFGFVSLAWVFFRASSVGGAVHMIGRMFADSASALNRILHLQPVDPTGGADHRSVLVGLSLILLLELIQILDNRIDLSLFVKRRSVLPRWAIYFGAIAAIYLMGASESRPFIYYQF